MFSGPSTPPPPPSYTNSIEIVQETILSPFCIKPEGLRALALVNIEKDPDSIYEGFEPQILQNEQGTGFLIIGYRHDGMVDVYFQPQLQVKVSDYSGLKNGANALKAVEFADSYLRFSSSGLHLFASFIDIEGREIVLEIDEQNPTPTKPFGLLAPVGTSSENPTELLLVFLEDFYFVRKSNTKVQILINGKSHKLDSFIPMDGKKTYFSRYTPRPVTVKVNPEFEGSLQPLPIINQKYALLQGNRIEIEYHNGLPEIKCIEQVVCKQSVTMTFTPSFPDIRDLQEGEKRTGKFTIQANEKTGTVSGQYSMCNKNNQVRIEMIPSGGWKPYPHNRWIVKTVFTVAKVFKRWPKTYQWNAIITYDPKGKTYYIQSSWRRINP